MMGKEMSTSTNGFESPSHRTDSKVTQAEIARFVELREQSRELDALRISIRDRLLAGTGQEPGQYYIGFTETSTRRLSREKLKMILGEQQADEIYELITPETSLRLDVHRDCATYRSDSPFSGKIATDCPTTGGQLSWALGASGGREQNNVRHGQPASQWRPNNDYE
jgi:hypothetical protein